MAGIKSHDELFQYTHVTLQLGEYTSYCYIMITKFVQQAYKKGP